MSAAWKIKVCRSVMMDDATPPSPDWSGNTPFCDDKCPHHDGKRCRLLGHQPGTICEPVVEAMGSEIRRLSV